jgi:SecD/SecF fusion protein
MSPIQTFFSGLLLLALFGWYFFTDSDRAKRILGSVLTVLLVALCLLQVNPPAEKLPLGLDLKGGTSFLIRLIEPEMEVADGKGAAKVEKREITPTMVDQAVEVIRSRVDKLGTSEPIITPQGRDRILVQIPGLGPAALAETREQLRKVAKLEFKMVHPESAAMVNETMPPDPAYRRQTYKDQRDGKPFEEQLMIKKKADIPGSMITGAHAFFDKEGYGVSLQFNKEGAELFGKLTAENVGKRFAIVLDGVIQSAPVIRDAIYGGSAQITGNFSEAQARGLSSVLENPLQNEVVIEEERNTSSTLGADSINSGIYSGVLGVILTVVCVLLYYRFAGLIANIALVVNMVLLFGAMAMFGTVLTLPGIAGIILTLGMAVDANVLIYERLREELADGKSNRAAVSAAFDKAFTAIFDSNVTTLITAIILFWKATGPVKGFAVTLTMGIIASLFTALIVTRNLFAWSMELGWLQRIRMSNLIHATKFDFLGKRRSAVALSLVLILGSFAVFGLRGEKNFGVDFRGGDRLVLEAQKSRPTDAEVRAVIGAMPEKVGDFVVQTETSANKVFTTVRSPQNTSEQISKQLLASMPEADFRVEQSEHVGSLVGGELARNSVIALALGMVGILVYVTLRFEFSYALGALVALIHDVVITIGAFALFDRELSLIIVGAVLTIAGYSVNDTIVVFDRIRESLNSGRKGSLEEVMNLSVNETLSRTILTGGVTLLTTAGLYLFGGPVLNDFAFAIFIGVLVGTYSSVFIAAPVVLWWTGKGGRRRLAESKPEAQGSAA